MRYLGKLFAVATAMAVAIGFVANAQAEGDDDAVTIVYLSHIPTSSDFGNVVRHGVELAAKETGVNLQYFAPETYDMVWMAQTLDAAVGTQPDAIAVAFPDADALGPGIELAVDAGIPVITWNSGIMNFQEAGALMHVGQEEFTAGYGAGVGLREAGGKIGLCVNQEVGVNALDERCNGFAEGFQGETTVLSTVSDPVEYRNAVSAHLMQHPEIDSIIILWAGLADPLVRAVESVDRLGTINLGTFDLNESALNYVLDGTFLFAIDQQPFLQGYLPIIFLNNLVKYGLFPANPIIQTGPNLVTADTVGLVMELSKQGIR